LDNSIISRIELGESLRESVNNWNMKTSYWLRVYVYERALEVGVTVRARMHARC
jgi:hypothetical protein